MSYQLTPQQTRSMLIFLSNMSSKTARIITAGFVIFQIIGLFLPFFANKEGSYSILNLLINTGKVEYFVIFLVYFIALIALSIQNFIVNRISIIFFLIGFGLQFYITWSSLDFMNDKSTLLTLLFMLWWLFAPIIAILFYTPLVFTKKHLMNDIKTIDKNLAWQRKTSFKDQVLPLIPVILLTAIFSIGAVFIEDKIICPDPSVCIVQGSWFSKAAIYLIGSAFFFGSLIYSFWPGKGIHPTERKLFRILLPFSVLTFAFTTYFGFYEGLSTNNNSITIRTVGDWGREKNTEEINWQDLRGFRIDTFKATEEYGDDCSFKLYLIKNSGSEIEIDSEYADNESIWIYLAKEKQLALEPYKSDECKFFKDLN